MDMSYDEGGKPHTFKALMQCLQGQGRRLRDSRHSRLGRIGTDVAVSSKAAGLADNEAGAKTLGVILRANLTLGGRTLPFSARSREESTGHTPSAYELRFL